MKTLELVKLHNVIKRFDTARPARTVLQPVNMTFHRGEFILLLGPSGSGKTTLLTIIAGFQSPSSGDVELFDKPLSAYSRTGLQKLRALKIGFIFQQFHLIEALTVAENITLVTGFIKRNRKEASEEANYLMNKFGIYHLRKMKPGQLSQGEKQRAATIRALIIHAPIIIADEPTGNLSTDQGMSIIQYISDSVRDEGRLAIVASHDERLAQYATRILTIRDGLLTEIKK